MNRKWIVLSAVAAAALLVCGIVLGALFVMQQSSYAPAVSSAPQPGYGPGFGRGMMGDLPAGTPPASGNLPGGSFGPGRGRGMMGGRSA